MIQPFQPQPSFKPNDRRVFLFHRRELCDRISPRISPRRSKGDRASNVVQLFPLKKAYNPEGTIFGALRWL